MHDSVWYAVGIALVVLGSVSGGLGMNLIKRSSRFERDLPLIKRKCLLWGLFLSTVFNTCLDVVSFALTPLSVIAPLGGVAIVAATAFEAVGTSGERDCPSRSRLAGTALVVLGIALAASFGPRPSSVVLVVDDVFRHYQAAPFAAYQLMTVTALTAVFLGMAADALPEFSLRRTFAVAAAGGMASGLCQSLIKLFATCAAAAAVDRAAPWSRLAFWLALLELATIGALLFLLLKFCMENSELTLSSSLYTVSVMLFTVLAGSAFYREFEAQTGGTSIVGFCFGLATIVAGIATLVLLRPEHRMPQPKRVSQSDETTTTTTATIAHDVDDEIIE